MIPFQAQNTEANANPLRKTRHMPAATLTVALVTDDLLLRSRLEPLVTAAGAGTIAVGTQEAVSSLFDSGAAPHALVVDLSAERLSPLSLIPRFRSRFPAAPIVAFGAHTDRETLGEATTLGCAAVLPRSRAVRELTQVLQELLGRDAISP